MENEKFQEFMADQFAKMFHEFQGLKSDVQGLKSDVQGLKSDVHVLQGNFNGLRAEFQKLQDSQVCMEDKFDKQITALHDFRVDQQSININLVERLDRIEVKVEVLQLETAHIRRVK